MVITSFPAPSCIPTFIALSTTRARRDSNRNASTSDPARYHRAIELYLGAFLEDARRRNTSRTADALALSQTAVSRRIQPAGT
jgi:hypothetical protein